MTPKPIVRLDPIPPLVNFENVVCTRCEKPVRMAFDSEVDIASTTQKALQPWNGLHLINYFGFGMRWDHDMFSATSRDIVLCEECTVMFLGSNPWLEEYLEQ
jgi:hypothetical protein